jgi:protein-disulfide isomerase
MTGRKKALIGLGVLLLIAIGGGAWFFLKPAPIAATAPGMPAASAMAASDGNITSYDRTMGDPKAPVTVIEYAAPICPHCAAFEMTSFPILKAGYIDSGKVFYVFRVFPLRPDDGPAEKLARCMPKEQYFSFMDLLFRNQPKWDGAEYPQVTDDHAGLVQVARIGGMSPNQADKCMADKSTDAAINKVGADGEAKYNLTGTPTFVVNGVVSEAGEEWPGLQKLIDAALDAKGVAH